MNGEARLISSGFFRRFRSNRRSTGRVVHNGHESACGCSERQGLDSRFPMSESGLRANGLDHVRDRLNHSTRLEEVNLVPRAGHHRVPRVR